MCCYCEPYGFDRMVCNFCGIHGDKVYISISIRLEGEDKYPYTTTDMYRKCWDEGGVESAKEHNRSIQAIIDGEDVYGEEE